MSQCCNGVRLSETSGDNYCVVHLAGAWIFGGQMAECGKQNSRIPLKNFYLPAVHALYNTWDLEYDRFYSSDYIIAEMTLRQEDYQVGLAKSYEPLKAESFFQLVTEEICRLSNPWEGFDMSLLAWKSKLLTCPTWSDRIGKWGTK